MILRDFCKVWQAEILGGKVSLVGWGKKFFVG
jgi:hypothetical protein